MATKKKIYAFYAGSLQTHVIKADLRDISTLSPDTIERLINDEIVVERVNKVYRGWLVSTTDEQALKRVQSEVLDYVLPKE